MLIFLEIKENFTLALREWSEQLEKEDKINDLFVCYEQAFKLFPECEMVVNNLGAQLFRLVGVFDIMSVDVLTLKKRI